MINRIIRSKHLFLTAFIPGVRVPQTDNVLPTSKTAKEMAEKRSQVEESGLDRIYYLFSVDEFGRPSPELVNVWHVTMLSMLVGAAIGGFVRSRVSFLDFVERNDATSFTSHMDAKKKLQDKVTTGFAKGAWQWGWRLTAFTTCYTVTSTMISTYRGKHGVMEHVIAGGITGATYKFNLGVRGVVVGGTLGVFLGTLSGLAIWGIMKTTGVTLDDLKARSYELHNRRENRFQERIDEHYARKEPQLVQDRDAKVGASNITLDSIQSEPATEKK